MVTVGSIINKTDPNLGKTLGNIGGVLKNPWLNIATGGMSGAIRTAGNLISDIGPKKVSAYTPAETAAQAEMRRQTEAILAQTAAINAQIAAQPRLLYRPANISWQNAQNTAAGSVNPVYVDNMNRFIEKQNTLRAQTTAETGAQKAASDTSLTQTQEDIGTNRTRTAEDTASAIAENRYNEGNWQTTEGKESDAAEEQARLALSEQGIMGRGAGQLAESKITRNQTSEQQTHAFDLERKTKKLLETRTFQDLDTKGTRAVQFNATEKANLDRQLSDYITNQGLEKKQFTVDNEIARQEALYQATENQLKTETANWLASLQGSGARNQDIAYTTGIYGR